MSSIERAAGGILREKGAAATKPSATGHTRAASWAVSAKIDTVSMVRLQGTMPRILRRPRLGFRPIRLFNAAGTRPDPAVSVPREKLASPSATATADPALDPPLM